MERIAENEMRRKLGKMMGVEAAKRIPAWFNAADVLKGAAFKTLLGQKAKGKKGKKLAAAVLTAAEAIRALKESYNIEADVLMPKVQRREDAVGEPVNDGPNNGKIIEEDRRTALHSKLARLAAGAKKKADP